MIRHGDVVSTTGEEYLFIVSDLHVLKSHFTLFEDEHVDEQQRVANKVIVYFQKKTKKILDTEAKIL